MIAPEDILAMGPYDLTELDNDWNSDCRTPMSAGAYSVPMYSRH